MAHRRSLPVFRESFGFTDELMASLSLTEFERIRFSPAQRSRFWPAYLPPGESRQPPTFTKDDPGNAVGIYPPLYYVPALLIEHVAADRNILVRLYLARLTNLIWAFPFGVFCYLACARIYTDFRAHVLAGAAIFLPQISFLFGVFSPDNAILAIYAFLYYAAIRTLEERRVCCPIMAGLLLGAGFWIKQTAVWGGVVYLSALFFVMSRNDREHFLWSGGKTMMAAGLVALPWLAFTFHLYGSLNPWSHGARTTMSWTQSLSMIVSMTTPQAQFAQFLGRFGWLDTRLPFALEAAVAVVAVLGILWTFGARWRQRLVWWATLAGPGGIAFILLGLTATGITTGYLCAPIGRYYCAFALPILVLVAAGFLDSSAAPRWKKMAGAGAILLNLYSFLFVLLPRYYG